MDEHTAGVRPFAVGGLRANELRDRVLHPEAFVAGTEDTFVIHADQVPMWLRIGTQKQLYGRAEVRIKKNS